MNFLRTRWQIKGNPDAISYRTAISARKPAVDLLERMEQYITDHNVISYSAATSAMENKKWAVTAGSGLVFRALHLPGAIQQRTLDANVIGNNSSISAGKKGRQWLPTLYSLGKM